MIESRQSLHGHERPMRVGFFREKGLPKLVAGFAHVGSTQSKEPHLKNICPHPAGCQASPPPTLASAAKPRRLEHRQPDE
jgi:hypothetical protein